MVRGSGIGIGIGIGIKFAKHRVTNEPEDWAVHDATG
jgi:hypothetical protein